MAGNMYILTLTNETYQNEDSDYVLNDNSNIEHNSVLLSSEENIVSNTLIEQTDPDTESRTVVGDDLAEDDVLTIATYVSAYKCKNCDFITPDKNVLIMHCKTCQSMKDIQQEECLNNDQEDETVMIICGKCSKMLNSEEECRRHMIKDHRMQVKPANTDKTKDIKFRDKRNMKSKTDNYSNVKYKNKITPVPKAVKEFWMKPRTRKEARTVLIGDRTVRCTFKRCLYKFSTTEFMLKHRGCHIELVSATVNSYQKSPSRAPTPLFVCPVCKTHFNNWPSCSLHLWRKHDISLDLVVCPLCSSVRTHSVHQMMQHLARHWHQNQETSKNSSSSELVMSQKNDDKDNIKLPRWYAKRKCEICNKLFSDSQSLKKHIQGVHKKIKPFICNVCGHAASRKSMMQLHMRQHTGEKPHACTYCKYKTGDHSTLRKHIMRHTGERPYKCTYCIYSSIQSSTLKKHIMSAHKNITQ